MICTVLRNANANALFMTETVNKDRKKGVYSEASIPPPIDATESGSIFYLLVDRNDGKASLTDSKNVNKAAPK